MVTYSVLVVMEPVTTSSTGAMRQEQWYHRLDHRLDHVHMYVKLVARKNGKFKLQEK